MDKKTLRDEIALALFRDTIKGRKDLQLHGSIATPPVKIAEAAEAAYDYADVFLAVRTARNK